MQSKSTNLCSKTWMTLKYQTKMMQTMSQDRAAVKVISIRSAPPRGDSDRIRTVRLLGAAFRPDVVYPVTQLLFNKTTYIYLENILFTLCH